MQLGRISEENFYPQMSQMYAEVKNLILVLSDLRRLERLLLESAKDLGPKNPAMGIAEFEERMRAGLDVLKQGNLREHCYTYGDMMTMYNIDLPGEVKGRPFSFSISGVF
jgi:hypothetical protein